MYLVSFFLGHLSVSSLQRFKFLVPVFRRDWWTTYDIAHTPKRTVTSSCRSFAHHSTQTKICVSRVFEVNVSGATLIYNKSLWPVGIMMIFCMSCHACHVALPIIMVNVSFRLNERSR